MSADIIGAGLTALDAFSGEGGATRGLMDAGFIVTAIDNDPNRLAHNPAHVKILVTDAVEFIAEHGHRYDFVWTSPPCQDYSAGTRAARAAGKDTGHLRLIAATREALQSTGRPWVIENVEGARSEMIDPVLLCGRMFDLRATDTDGVELVLDRHRLFESSMPLVAPAHPKHGSEQVGGSYGGARRDKHEARNVRHGGYVPAKSVQEKLLGIDWMTQKGLYLSIPPAYARHIGEQVMGLNI
jgi:DNA (cytosine-5)-methyltransferase 1